MNKTIYIIRHGETELNRTGVIQGSGVNSELNATGHQQASAFFKTYQHIPFEAVLTSRLIRTHQTVASFLETGVNWEQFAEINEIGWGIHEGKKGKPWMIAEYRDLREAWASGDLSARIKDGESAAEMGARLSKFIEHLKSRREETILVCSHGRAMRALVCLMHERPLSEMDNFKHSNTGLYLAYQKEERFEFELKNDLSHL